MYIKKIKNIVIRKYKHYKLILKTTKNKLARKSDISRWSKQQALFSSWDERTRLLADAIASNSKVFEFGAARLVLKNMLPAGSTYLHSDIVSRAEDTLVVDLNKEIPEIPNVDVIVFSGVLEYIFDVKQLLETLNPKTKCFVFSYATTDRFPKTSKRREHGWVSDLSLKVFENVALKLNRNLIHLGEWKSQHLFKME